MSEDLNMPKYRNINNGLLDSDLYHDKLKDRGREEITLARTVSFQKMQNLQVEVLEEHVWSSGDSLLKLSTKYYGTTQYWWTIGMVNKKPTDAHYTLGDIVYIPRNPQKIEGSVI